MQKPFFVHNHLSMYKKCCCHAFLLFKGTFLRNKHLRHYYSTLFFCNLGLDHVRVNSSYIINMYVLLKSPYIFNPNFHPPYFLPIHHLHSYTIYMVGFYVKHIIRPCFAMPKILWPLFWAQPGDCLV